MQFKNFHLVLSHYTMLHKKGKHRSNILDSFIFISVQSFYILGVF